MWIEGKIYIQNSIFCMHFHHLFNLRSERFFITLGSEFLNKAVIFNSALSEPSLQSDNVILFLSPSVNRCFVLHLTMPLNSVFVQQVNISTIHHKRG